MLDERRRILNMLAEGKISATDADGLLAAMADTETPPPVTEVKPAAPKSPKYLRVLVEAHDGDNSNVNIRVPINLIRAGVRLTALLPTGLHDQINKALRENGVDFDISKLKPENLEELVEHLADLSVDVDGGNGDRVRIYCE
jgi:Asp-tRNA(Asn)/Glu-tRNA(Gln) amidotransferase B subunit